VQMGGNVFSAMQMGMAMGGGKTAAVPAFNSPAVPSGTSTPATSAPVDPFKALFTVASPD